MTYIFVKKYTSQNMKNCIYISKIKSWVEFCNDFFGGEYIDIHQLN